MYLIDSNYLIDYLNGIVKVGELLNSLDADEWSTSVICVGEVLEGRNIQNQERIWKMVERMKVYDIDLKIAVEFARIRKILRNEGNLVDNMDLLIAATCVANDLTLVTGNKKHFERVKGLKVLG